jgi:hypothetical protein
MSDQLRSGALVAGLTVYAVVRRRFDESSRTVSLAVALLAAGAVLALVHLADADLRALYSGGEPRLVPTVVALLSRPDRAQVA